MTLESIIHHAKQALGIDHLNHMQEQVLEQWCTTSSDLIVYSPTGSGKTLATAIPALLTIDDAKTSPQVVVIVPSRELALQTNNVLKKISPLTSTTCCYGGHNSSAESLSLKSCPKIVVGTPGRLLYHIDSGNVDMAGVKCLILDEFDKSLELGFSDQMSSIMGQCGPQVRTLLTSATAIGSMPHYVKLTNPYTLNLLQLHELNVENRITMWRVTCKEDHKIETLCKLLHHIPDERTIVFTNTRESAQQVFNSLSHTPMSVELYHGMLVQLEREKAIDMFNNGSAMVMVATDLASRGLDIDSVKHIVHYELPLTHEILIHRNGRTARVDAHGNAYFITTNHEPLPSFAGQCNELDLSNNTSQHNKVSALTTLHISAGKKEKVSRGDIVGFLVGNVVNLTANEIGKINIHDHYSLVAVTASRIDDIINSASLFKLKKQKVKLSVAKPKPRLAKS